MERYAENLGPVGGPEDKRDMGLLIQEDLSHHAKQVRRVSKIIEDLEVRLKEAEAKIQNLQEVLNEVHAGRDMDHQILDMFDRRIELLERRASPPGSPVSVVPETRWDESQYVDEDGDYDAIIVE